jgi:hypothetical protein
VPKHARITLRLRTLRRMIASCARVTNPARELNLRGGAWAPKPAAHRARVLASRIPRAVVLRGSFGLPKRPILVAGSAANHAVNSPILAKVLDSLSS